MSRIRTTSAALIAAVALALVVLMPGTASANTAFSLTVTCITPNPDGSFNAVFGYNNSTGAEQDVAVGTQKKKGSTYTNVVTPAKYDGSQPTHFYKGSNPAAFSVKFAAHETVTWEIVYDQNGATSAISASVSASASSERCAVGPELPGAGNGSGSLIVIAVSGIITGVVYLARRLRGGRVS